jgi:hypothetical protein
MKVPIHVQEKVAELAARIIDDDASEVDIGAEGALWLARQRDPAFRLAVLAEWWRGESRKYIYGRSREKLRRSDASGQLQLPLPFPELDPYLETSIGHKTHQRMMTRIDLRNWLAIVRNRREQAEISYQTAKARVEQFDPWMIDDTVTVADVMHHLDDDMRQAQ